MLTIEDRFNIWVDTEKESYQALSDYPLFIDYLEYQENQQQENVTAEVVSSIGSSDMVAHAGAIEAVNLDSPFILPAEQEETDFQVWQRAKKAHLQGLITNEPVLLDFKVALPRKGYALKCNTIDENVVNGLFTWKRIGLPIFQANSSSRYTAIIADFDILPSDIRDWDTFRMMLNDIFGNRAIITVSEHNKAKVWFFAEGRMTLPEKKLYLKSQFEGILGNLWTMKGLKTDKAGKEVKDDVLDKAGIEASIITWDMLDTLKAQINNILYISLSSNTIVLHSEKALINKEELSIEPTWRLWEGSLPETIAAENKHIQFVFRFLCSNFVRSINTSLDLPTPFLSKVSGFNQRFMWSARKRLIEMGVIEETSKAYKVGSFGKSYRFSGLWSSWAKKEFEKIKISQDKKTLPEVLASFIDGNWNEALWNLSGLITEPTAYLKQVKMVSGWNDKPERFKQALNALKCRKKYQELKAVIKKGQEKVA